MREDISRSEVESLLAHYDFPFPLQDFKTLFGGYSGTSIRVEGAGNQAFVLKICHGYERADVEAQARCAVYARQKGFAGACTFLALRPQSGLGSLLSALTPVQYSVERASDKTPCCLLTWVDGSAADKVIAQGKVPAKDVLRAVGAGLGALHSVAAPSGRDGRRLRACEADNGACDVRKHLSGDFSRSLEAAPAVREHPFLAFYAEQVTSLQAAFSAPGLARGVLHGDPFLDNILVRPSDGTFEGFVDLEDVCVGPLLFDLACCASAACFRPHDNALDVRCLRALLTGYSSTRRLSPAEKANFVAFMKLTMLCNCSWRFKNFNIDHRELESCRNAHVELQERILALEDDMTAGFIEGILAELPDAPGPTGPPEDAKKPYDGFAIAATVAATAILCAVLARRSAR